MLYEPGPPFQPSSPFGPRRRPNGDPSFHWGRDWRAPEGTPVPAANKASGRPGAALKRGPHDPNKRHVEHLSAFDSGLLPLGRGAPHGGVRLLRGRRKAGGWCCGEAGREARMRAQGGE